MVKIYVYSPDKDVFSIFKSYLDSYDPGIVACSEKQIRTPSNRRCSVTGDIAYIINHKPDNTQPAG